jgi:hypothetical protein
VVLALAEHEEAMSALYSAYTLRVQTEKRQRRLSEQTPALEG